MEASVLLHRSALLSCGETGFPSRISPCSSSSSRVIRPHTLLPRLALAPAKGVPQGRLGCRSSFGEHFLSSTNKSEFSDFIDRRFLRNTGLLSDDITKERKLKTGVVQAAWTRRSRGEAAKRPNKKSWSQRTDMYMRPFLLNVFFSKRYIHAKVVHRSTCKVISVASTNAKDLRNNLPSLIDDEACRVVGRLIAERSKEADVFVIAYDAKKDERIEGRLGIVLDTIKENGIIFV